VRLGSNRRLTPQPNSPDGWAQPQPVVGRLCPNDFRTDSLTADPLPNHGIGSTAADHAPGFSFQGNHRRAIALKIRPPSCIMAFITYNQVALSQFHNLPKP